MSSLCLLCLSALISTIYGHSWVRCSDYGGTITGGDYNEADCNGWIRSWTFNNIEFGLDRGINYQVGVGSGQNLCPTPLSSDASSNYAGHYSDSTKLARYSAGESIQVVWPAKNHANYECFNYIPDTSMKLFMNPNVNPTSDLPNTASTMTGNGYELVKDWHEGCNPTSDGCGFQNCPKFCDNTDRATCFQYFTVPDVSQSGYYTFVWYWIFNPGTPYISCFEAYIDASGTATSSSSSTTSTTTTTSTSTTTTSTSTQTPSGSSSTSTSSTTSTQPPSTSTSSTSTTQQASTSTISSTSSTLGGHYSNEYMTQIPYCITGAEYNEDTTFNFVERHFEDYLDEAEFGVYDVTEGTKTYDFTLQFSHEGSEVSSITDAAYTYCDEYISVYGSDRTCSICEDMMTFRVFIADDVETSSPTVPSDSDPDAAVSSGDKDDGNGNWLQWFIMGVGIFLVVAAIIFFLCHKWCKKEMRTKKENYYPSKQQQVNGDFQHNVTTHAVVAMVDE